MEKVIDHILILTETPFQYRDYQRFGVETLSKSFKVHVLDMTMLIRPSFWDNFKQTRYEFSGYRIIERIDEVFDVILKLHGTAVAIDYLFSGEVQSIIRVSLRAHDILRTTVLAGLIPTNPVGQNGIVRNIARNGRDILNKNYSSFRVLIRQYVTLPAQICDISIIAGSHALTLKHSRTPYQIFGHSLDYDLFLEFREKKAKDLGYIVFLDQGLVGHPDRHVTGNEPIVTAKNYYSSMNNFFSIIEDSYGLPVKIAGQPKIKYEKEHPFYQRDIIKNDTALAVKNASFVLAHYSTAISFAVLWKKPIILLSTDELVNSWVQKFWIDAFQRELRVSMINVDLPYIDKKLYVSDLAYRQYQEKFIKAVDTPELPLWHIFSGAVKNIN